jgi:type I restriction enzyme R subunit
MNAGMTESILESAALTWFEPLGLVVKHGPEIAPDGRFAERVNCREVVLASRLEDALLPKLIGGEIREKDAERFLKERGL